MLEAKMLKIDHLVKTYGDKRAVDDLSLQIEPGEVCGFIGHNGAGKTTTIKSICGILTFDSGEITVAGKSVRRDPIGVKREIAYIPDNPELYDFLTGIKYLNFIADVYGVSSSMRQERIRTYANRLEIKDDLAEYISSYSHGMKQKLAIVSALVHDPKLIIMDEPFIGLDPKAARALKEIMAEKCVQGCSVFFSTHMLEVAERLCDKVAIIKSGRLVAYGEMDEVRGDSSLETIFFELEGDS
jgi:ABC-2 type transport system ATP-binding protein